MKWMLGRGRLELVSGALGALILASSASAGSRPEHPYRYSVIDVPVSLAVGIVRKPEFSPRKTSWHWIMVQVEKPFPPLQMRCMIGTTLGRLDLKDCPNNDPLLQADWTVWEGEHVVAQGSNEDNCACKFDDKHIFRFLGKFPALSGNKYVLEVKFTKDGTPLNIANPHLIVTKIDEE